MRTLLAAALACGCLCGRSALARAGAREDALAIIEQAVKAHGGEAALAKVRSAVRTGVGVLYQGGEEIKFTDEMTWNLPDQWRESVQIDKKVQLEIAVNGDKGWQSVAGRPTDLIPERLKELREEMYVLSLETLTPLRGEGYDLSPLPETRVNGRPALGVKAAHKGRPDARLFFDADTHLLVRIARTSQEGGLTLEKEYLFSDHKEFDGVKLPTRLAETQGGKKTIEWTSASYQFLAKPDEAAFTRP